MGTENRDVTPATTAAELTRTCQEDSLTRKVVTVVEDTWAAIRELHSEVPNAVIVVASGTSSRLPRWGHYAAMRWQHGDDWLPEVLVSGEGSQTASHRGADNRSSRSHARPGRHPRDPGHVTPGALAQPTIRDAR